MSFSLYQDEPASAQWRHIIERLKLKRDDVIVKKKDIETEADAWSLEYGDMITTLKRAGNPPNCDEAFLARCLKAHIVNSELKARHDSLKEDLSRLEAEIERLAKILEV